MRVFTRSTYRMSTFPSWAIETSTPAADRGDLGPADHRQAMRGNRAEICSSDTTMLLPWTLGILWKASKTGGCTCLFVFARFFWGVGTCSIWFSICKSTTTTTRERRTRTASAVAAMLLIVLKSHKGLQQCQHHYSLPSHLSGEAGFQFFQCFSFRRQILMACGPQQRPYLQRFTHGSRWHAVLSQWQHQCHRSHHQAAEPISHVAGLWTFFPTLESISSISSSEKNPNCTQARRSGKKNKNITAPCAHPIAGSAAFPRSSFFEFTGCERDAPQDVSLSL